MNLKGALLIRKKKITSIEYSPGDTQLFPKHTVCFFQMINRGSDPPLSKSVVAFPGKVGAESHMCNE